MTALALQLSKSKYLSGIQCSRRLWLASHARDLATPAAPALTTILDAGTEIGRRARDLFADGILVDEEAWDHGRALDRTRQLLLDPAVGAIFEAAFEHAGVRVRVDVLERLGDGAWGLREVKSGTRVKDVHLHDVAIQRFVVESSGIRLPSVEVVHVDGQYVRGDDGIEWRRFFTGVDVTSITDPLLAEVPKRLVAQHAVLGAPRAPVVEPALHCSEPYQCEFWAYCTAGKPKDWILHLPRLSAQRHAMLRDAGIERIVHIPDDFPLSPHQSRARSAWLTGGMYVDAGLASDLASAGPPADYLDFETAFPAIPLYAGMRPYQQVPFQWSLHRVGSTGKVTHLQFLADGTTDPREAFADSLTEALRQANGPILVWSGFEHRIIGELITGLPHRTAALAELQSRIVDLLPVVRANIYHSDFAGSFSIKRVAPALVPALTYEDLADIADGSQAADALVHIARGAIESPEEVLRIRRALLEYCKRDTLAMVEVHRQLRACAGADQTS